MMHFPRRSREDYMNNDVKQLLQSLSGHITADGLAKLSLHFGVSVAEATMACRSFARTEEDFNSDTSVAYDSGYADGVTDGHREGYDKGYAEGAAAE